MTNLEKQLISAIENGSDVWGLIQIAQQYKNDQLLDRVLDNILKLGIEKIREKPNRIFYGDNHKILPLQDELVGNEAIHIFEGIGIGKEFDEIAEIIACTGILGFDNYLKAKENRKPVIKGKYQINLPIIQLNVILKKQCPFLTNNLRKILRLANIKVPDCDIVVDLPEGIGCLNTSSTNVTIITIR